MEVTSYVKVYSTMFENKHSHIVVDDGTQSRIPENIAYNDKNAHCTITSKNYSKQ